MRLPAICLAKWILALRQLFLVQGVRHHRSGGHIQAHALLVEQHVGFARNEGGV